MSATSKPLGFFNFMSDIFEQKKAFNFYRSYYDTSLLLDGESKLQFLEAILHYQFTGEIIEPKNNLALLAFKCQIHSLNKQVIGYQKGKNTYPNGNPTKGNNKGNYKGSHKEEQEEVQEQVKDKEEIKDTPSAFSFYHELLKLGAEKQLVSEWLAVRKKKKLTNTETALKGFLKQVEKSGNTLNDVLTKCIEKSWGGFEAEWYKKEKRSEEKIRMF